MANYRDFHRRSLAERASFWSEEAGLIHWQRPFDEVLDYSRPPFARWFVGGRTNLCHNAIDRHLAARGDQKALVWISTEVNQTRSYTYRQLFDEVNRVAAMMQELGVKQGDRVIIYMPMIAEAAFAMLACARLGAIHSVVFGGFAAASLAARIDDAKPALMVTADGGSRMGKAVLYKSLVDESLKLAKHPPRKVLLSTAGWTSTFPSCRSATSTGRRWRRSTAAPRSPAPGSSRANLPTSLHLGHHRPAERRAARRGRLRRGARLVDEAHLLRRAGRDHVHHLGHRLGGRALLHRLRAAHRRRDTIMYEGVPIRPDAGVWWKIVQDYKVAVMFSAPTAIRC
jgi:propionyl-CoA synthetase